MVELRAVRPSRRLTGRPCSRSRNRFRGLPDSFRGLLAVACLAVVGCQSVPHRDLGQARIAFAAGQPERAREVLTKWAGRPGRWNDPAQLDLAILELASGEPHAAERRLRKLRDRFDETPASDVGREAVSLVTDDTHRRYRPAGYEQVMIRAMLAVCSLAGDGVDAESYTLQAMAKQAELARNAEERGLAFTGDDFRPIAVAPYLRGVVREATHRDYDDAARAYQLVSHVRPQFLPVREDLERAGRGVHSAPGHGVLYLLACVGRGPQLREVTAPTTSAALTLASAFVADQQRARPRPGRPGEPVLPNIASVKVPEVVIPPSGTAAVSVHIDGRLWGATQTLTDVGELARRQCEIEMPWTIARAVARRVTKETTIRAARDQLGISGTAGGLVQFAAATAWSAGEQADTRCWGLLPREVQVLRAEIPVGVRRLALTPVGPGGGGRGPTRSVDVTIEDGRNQYLVVFAADAHLQVTGAAQ